MEPRIDDQMTSPIGTQRTYIDRLQTFQPCDIILDEERATTKLYHQGMYVRTGKPVRHNWRTVWVDETG